MNRTEIEHIRNKLNYFSFSSVINKENYNGETWKDRAAFIDKNKCCCTICEDNNCATPISEQNESYQLKYVSHGTHALDFCESMGIVPNENWSDVPVLFLFENPSIQYGNQYEEHVGKCPAQKWYWLRDGNSEADFSYPKYYKQGYYGDLIASLIKTFRLGNAYMTNFVKCAMNDADGKHYLGTAEYKEECIENCFKKILLKEIEILTNNFQKDLVVFAFSRRVYNLVQQYFNPEEHLMGKCLLCLMPHPASRLANDYRKYVLFGKVFKTLKSKNVDCDLALQEFLENDKTESIPYICFQDCNRKALIERFKEKDITINDTKISKINTGTIKFTRTQLNCKFNLEDGIFEFGINLDADTPLWVWDNSKRVYIEPTEIVSTKLCELYKTFCDYIYELGLC